MKIGIISGYYINELINDSEKIMVETSFGDILIHFSKMKQNEIFLINRHGKNSNIPPHKINYRGNIQAFSLCHVECILSLGSVGSMKKNIKTGDFVVPHDFIDFTKSRQQSFFDDKRVHVDMTNPFCTSLRKLLIKSCLKMTDIDLHQKGTYLTTEGPRLETVSEINFFSKFADIVGMTLVPEVILAREKGICYTSLSVVTNMAAGLQISLTSDEILKIYNEKNSIISKIFRSTFSLIKKRKDCDCKKSLLGALL
jgi:5'-methylthioadenosine phosphorylase